MRKLLISLPDALADRLDQQVKTLHVTRSAYLRGAIERDLTRLARLRREEALRQGYEQMASLELDWARLAHAAEQEALERYEDVLAAQEERTDS